MNPSAAHPKRECSIALDRASTIASLMSTHNQHDQDDDISHAHSNKKLKKEAISADDDGKNESSLGIETKLLDTRKSTLANTNHKQKRFRQQSNACNRKKYDSEQQRRRGHRGNHSLEDNEYTPVIIHQDANRADITSEEAANDRDGFNNNKTNKHDRESSRIFTVPSRSSNLRFSLSIPNTPPALIPTPCRSISALSPFNHTHSIPSPLPSIPQIHLANTTPTPSTPTPFQTPQYFTPASSPSTSISGSSDRAVSPSSCATVSMNYSSPHNTINAAKRRESDIYSFPSTPSSSPSSSSSSATPTPEIHQHDDENEESEGDSSGDVFGTAYRDANRTGEKAVSVRDGQVSVSVRGSDDGVDEEGERDSGGDEFALPYRMGNGMGSGGGGGNRHLSIGSEMTSGSVYEPGGSEEDSEGEEGEGEGGRW
ncbi:hypothetical protein B0J11DRAFT_602497 [Dendryphion nanum]|uniref:Uncharacterized protein n=1 Tax=Dendryphion nanum TaxID=256645 RepID=A0A9P9IR87_9PLEO|nr:hypothetical protein B0J11DRAFT_602497 [Dendryphion nanum]